MKRTKKIIGVFLGIVMAFQLSACQFFDFDKHTHQFTCRKAEDLYKYEDATCQHPASYYLSCECGEKGEETFYEGLTKEHDFSNQLERLEYLKKPATCQTGAEYFYSCVMCGEKGTTTFYDPTLAAHNYSQEIPKEEFLASPETCQSRPLYYFSCLCGDIGTETFALGDKGNHKYTAEREEEKYFYLDANCMHGVGYYKSCETCGKAGTNVFFNEELADCVFNIEDTSSKFLKSEATMTTSEVYYKSCICGAKGEETFAFGSPLKNSYTEQEKAGHIPTSPVVTLYDTLANRYGFTYNIDNKPLRPVLQIVEGTQWNNNYQEYYADFEKAYSYDKNDEIFDYYIVKIDVQLEANTTYTYKFYDKYVKVGSEEFTITTKNPKSTAFTFAHISDSQENSTDKTGYGTGIGLNNVLSKITGADFLLHTGDIVEYAKYEGFWDYMLNANSAYLTKIPMMAVSGNHETTYCNGENEVFKHFHNKLPNQSSTTKGYFYSFVYGNAKFIMLNTNDLSSDQLKAEQYNWLVNELKNNTSTWTFVALHHPIYSAGQYVNSDATLGLRAQLQSIFVQYGVDVVLQGHDHVYAKTHPLDGAGVAVEEVTQEENGVTYSISPKGVIYVENGPAGPKVGYWSGDSSVYDYTAKAEKYSWAEFSIDGNKLTVALKYTNGTNVNVYQTWGIIKN